MSKRTVQGWFNRSCTGEYIIEKEFWSVLRPVVDDDCLGHLIKTDPVQTAHELADNLRVHHTTISSHYRQIGRIYNLGQGVPRKLTDHNRQRPSTNSLSAGCQRSRLLKKTVSVRQRQATPLVGLRFQHVLTQAKASNSPGKMMLCIWCDCKGFIYFKLLPINIGVIYDLDCQELYSLATPELIIVQSTALSNSCMKIIIPKLPG